ncbi:sensor histidine kinase [Sporomusa sphaeroides]|jgi:two-component system sensor histidine kinase VanS|uniref:sensor histidine kinase n=1 Tax=Sporomusa sphaeroides TaxID=47679 RepID=UPI002C66D0D2|nr:HAMP domain-containing sensor histidine kinase [Sporomusa sphaeroides]HML34631.1 HAMP domain-containing sensor histidine kinase [Sporomusa sphaeroides]
MRIPIKTKLYLGMSGLVLLYVGLVWLLNTQYLEKYYMSKKQDLLIHNSQIIDDLYKDDPGKIASTLEQLESDMSVSIRITGTDGITKYSSIYRLINGKPFFPEATASPDQTSRANVSSNYLKIDQSINDQFILEIQKDPILNRDYLVLERKLQNGDVLMLRIRLSTITESVAIANQFMGFTAIPVILLGCLWTVVFARRFTHPIIQLKEIAHSMANLDFRKKCQHQSNDEVSDLADSINYLSDQLDLAIQELHLKNQRLTEDIQKKRQLEHLRKEFISNVSHELKTPISLISGYAEGLKANVMEDETNKSFYCEVIMDEARKMDQTVKDLLNLAQLESEYFQLNKTVFDIAVLVKQVLYKYTAIFAEKSIKLSVETSNEILVYADRGKIEQVIVNFINNALSHVNQDKIISLDLTPYREKIRLSVMNSGSHIADDSLDKIWISFYRADQARPREDGRVGLGLAIVKAIQERHHNNFGAENLDQGVRFWIELDRAKFHTSA